MKLIDNKIDIKIRLAFLWSSVMFCYIYGDYFGLYAPGVVADIIKGKMVGLGEVNPMKLFGASFMMLIPSIMPFLSITLKSHLNRIINIVFGIIYTLIMLLTMITGTIDSWDSYYFLFGFVEIILTITVVVKAYKWPKAKEVSENC